MAHPEYNEGPAIFVEGDGHGFQPLMASCLPSKDLCPWLTREVYMTHTVVAWQSTEAPHACTACALTLASLSRAKAKHCVVEAGSSCLRLLKGGRQGAVCAQRSRSRAAMGILRLITMQAYWKGIKGHAGPIWTLFTPPERSGKPFP